ncbi:hypothetical protein GF108_17845 [Phyllobacterium sp. SYP-B3895]|uniref:hypothetical protein n=1 Tax=Phyllobacterium sp. SYP-B3895 TaxID=2663240 RepID=UPI00129999C8|nr:hypothetical protein [Phyllobacterium sp. SYP-B3895]MRG57433.1 hypothetical protein [Phyllobacterium sp. SYP-B3895]
MRRPVDRRIREQRERQQAYRARLRQQRRPGRDDIARILLYEIITRSVALDRRADLEQLVDRIVEKLDKQGFDVRASYEVFDDLIEKYTKTNFGFRRKLHLADGAAAADDDC